MEKHELDLVTNTCTISCNYVLLQDFTRHTRTLPFLTNLEGSREADLRGLSPFTDIVTGTQDCALGVHEVDVHLSLGKRVPLGRLQ
jgi:hypothetical protein